MNELVSLFLLAAVMTDAPEAAMPRSHAPALSRPQMAQLPLGQVCLTKAGSCIIPPRPINTQCFCGNVPGVVR